MHIDKVHSEVFMSPEEAVGHALGRLGGGSHHHAKIVSIQVMKVDNGWKAFVVFEEPYEEEEPEQSAPEKELESHHHKHEHEREKQEHDDMIDRLEHEKEHEAVLMHENLERLEPSPSASLDAYALAEFTPFLNPIIYNAPIEVPLERDYIPEGVFPSLWNEQRIDWLDEVFQNDFELAEFGHTTHGFLTPGLNLAPVWEAPHPEPC